jgi:hypothetical protein
MVYGLNGKQGTPAVLAASEFGRSFGPGMYAQFIVNVLDVRI